jgi:hypothetical protein
LQENIRKLFRANDWTEEEVKFDSYVEDYDW